MEGARRTRLQASGLLVITFVVGALVGAAGNRVVASRQSEEGTEVATKGSNTREEQDSTPRRSRRDSTRRGSLLLEPQVLDQLNITPEQRSRIEAILTRRDKQNTQLFQTIRPKLDTLMQSTRAELQAQLTEEQRVKFAQIIKERHERWQAQREQRDKNRSSDGKPRTDSAK